MKQGRTLSSLAAEIERQAAVKRDFLAPMAGVRMRVKCPDEADSHSFPVLTVPGAGTFPVNSHAHSQIAAHLDIPKKYYDRMASERPHLLAENVNTWIEKNQSGKRLIRTLDGKARAFLSDRYQPFDNDVIAQHALTVLQEVAPTLELRSCELTERRLYIKATFPTIQREVNVGDVVESGILISNSEIGAGALEVAPFSFRLVCKNGMKHNDLGQRRTHIGRVLDAENGTEIFASDTLRADAKAFLLKLRDVIRSTVSGDQFDKIVAQMREAAGHKIEGNPVEAVEVMTRKFNLLEGEKGSIMRHLIEGGDLSQWGLANAVTRTAEDAADYDRASELEATGGKLIELTPAEWRTIAIAA